MLTLSALVSHRQIVILLMTSGYMWNQIRRPQYSQPGRNGQISYIAGGYQTQLGAETHIVAAICESSQNTLQLSRLRLTAFSSRRLDGVLGFSTYALAHIIPKLNDPVRQRLGIYVWTGVFVIMVGVMMNVFQMKQPGCKLALSCIHACASTSNSSSYVLYRPLPYLLNTKNR